MPVIPILFAIWLLSRNILRVVREAIKQPETRGLVYGVALIVALGTVIFRVVEGWGWVDSLYFTVVTLTTVGYGDLTPQTDLGKLFTIVYILAGLGILGSFIALIAERQRPGPFNRAGNQPETESNNDGG